MRDIYIPVLECDDYSDFMERVESATKEAVEMDNDNVVTIIAKHDEINEMIRLFPADWKLADVDLTFGYDKEYCCTFFADYFGNITIWIHQFYDENDNPIELEGIVTFIFEDCAASCLNTINSGVIVQVQMSEDENDNDSYESNSSYISRDNTGKPNGFTKDWAVKENGVMSHHSYSYYSDNYDDLKDVASIFDVDL